MRSVHSLRALGLAITLGLTVAACGGHGEEPKSEEKAAGGQTVTVVTASSQNLDRTVTASGTISAWEEVPIGAETGGLTATAVLVDEGSYVRQGQPLVQLNTALLSARCVSSRPRYRRLRPMPPETTPPWPAPRN